MAVVNVSLLIILIFLSSVQANLTCNETQCKLLSIGEDVVWKFQELAAEKGVRMIYLNTEMGNDSYHPLESNERLFDKRWVWANTVSEPMLSLLEDKDDFVVHSLGFLEYQVRHLTVPLQDQPRGCLTRLNTSCQNNVVGQTLLGNFTKVTSDKRLFKAVPTDCVCVLQKVDSAELRSVCCAMESFTELPNNARVHCELRAQSAWLQVLYGMQDVFTLIILLYSAALPLLLPDWLFNLQREYEKDNSMESQIKNNQVVPDQQYQVDQRENSGNEMTEEHSYSGDRYLKRDTDIDSIDKQQLRGHHSPDQHHEIEQRVDTHATGNEHNLIFVRPIDHFENNTNEGIDQHQTKGNKVSNDIHNGPVQREVSAQGTNEGSSCGEERNVRRESDNEIDDDQQQTRSQESTDYQQETEQRVELENRTSEESSFVGVVINPYGEQLTVVREDEDAVDREIPLDDESPITFGAMLSDYVKELPDFNISFNIKMLFLCFGVLPFFVYLKIALIMFNRMESYREFYQTFKNCSEETLQDAMFCSAIVGFSWVKIHTNVMNIFVLVGCVVLFVTLLSVRPKDFLYLKYQVSSGWCPLHSNCPSVSLGHEIIVHLNLLRHWAYDLTFLTLWRFTSVLKRYTVGCVLRKITLQIDR